MAGPEKTPGNESDDGPATKQAVYDAAVRLFARKGFAATGMRELSREAGVNLAAVNYFYGSKKGLLKAILDDFFTGILTMLSEDLAGDDTPEVKLRRLVAALARYYASARNEMLIALAELPHDDPDITEFKAQWFPKLHGLFQDNLGAAASRVPPGIIAPAMVGLVASRFLFLPLMEKALPPEALRQAEEVYPDMVAELFVNGFSGLLAAHREADDG